MTALRFEIPGEPMGQPRHRSRIATKSDGASFIANYDPKKAVRRKREIKAIAERAMFCPIITGPVAIEIVAQFTLPKSKHRKRQPVCGQSPHTSKPDCDNIAKLVLDAINGIVFKDDSQVSRLEVSKMVMPQEVPGRTLVYVEEMG